MKCLWGIALSCFCALVSLGLLQAENLSREPLASFPPFTEESLLPFDPETQEIVDDGLVLTHPGIAYATYEQRLSDTSITVEAEFADTILLVGVQNILEEIAHFDLMARQPVAAALNRK